MATRVEYEFDPFDIVGMDRALVDPDRLDEVMHEIQNFVKESVLLDVAEQLSPVNGRNFPQLSPEYKHHKEDEGGTPVPNLELTGQLMSSVVVDMSGDKLLLTVGDDQQGKADGHNNFSGDSKLPLRRFIPNANDGETFRPKIRDGIREIIQGALVVDHLMSEPHGD